MLATSNHHLNIESARAETTALSVGGGSQMTTNRKRPLSVSTRVCNLCSGGQAWAAAGGSSTPPTLDTIPKEVTKGGQHIAILSAPSQLAWRPPPALPPPRAVPPVARRTALAWAQVPAQVLVPALALALTHSPPRRPRVVAAAAARLSALAALVSGVGCQTCCKALLTAAVKSWGFGDSSTAATGTS